jgi:hypothetical protein
VTNRSPAALRSLVSVVTLLLTGCGLTNREWRTLDAWLTCDECIDGERAAAKAIGHKAVPAFTSALVGPPANRQALVRAQFVNSYPGLGIAGLTPDAYADLLLANYIATYQKRAAISLGDLGGDDAKAALNEALAQASARAYREDVVRLIRYVVTSSNAAPFGGRLTPLRVAFGDTLTVTGSATQPFNGDELAEIDGAPFPPTEVVLSRATNEFKIVALGEAGAHGVAITKVGTGTSTQVAALTIQSVLDANDRAMLSCETLRCSVDSAPRIAPSSLPYQSFLSLWRTPPRTDTVDVVRIHPDIAPAGAVTPLTVTATLNWEGAANLDLRWRRCSTLGSVGNDSGATGANPERSSITISDDCWALLVLLLPGGALEPRAFARLRITSP